MTKAVILAGGSGTRLWPLSREALPKQFLAFDERGTLLQQTFERLRLVLSAEDIYVCTLPRYSDLVRDQLPELRPEQLVAEPCPRGTGPASAYVAAWLASRHGDVTAATFAADARVENPQAFAAALAAALAAVDDCPDAVAAIGVAILIPGLLPGFRSSSILDVGKGGGGGVQVDPLVSITSSLKQSTPVPLFLVRSDTSTPTYWHWISLDHFDGTTWTTDDLKVEHGQTVDSGLDLPSSSFDTLARSKGGEARSDTVTLDQEITLLNPPNIYLPAAYRPVAISITGGGTLRYDPVIGAVRQQAPFPRVVGSPPVVPAGAPELGADTDDVLSSLGMSTDEIEGLRAKGVV